MTLDEQIKILENNAEYIRKEGDLQGCLNFKQLAEWLKDYKNLLEQEPCRDCISRAEAQKRISIRLYELALNTVGYDYKTSDIFKDIAEKLSTWISEIPSIQPKPKTGHWIWDYGYATCNQCGYTRDSKDNEGQDIPDNYCPNCGADMTESEEKE